MQALQLIPSAISAFSAYKGMKQGAPADKVQLPPMWQMPNMTGAANNAYEGIGGLSGGQANDWALPQYQNITQNMLNNPFASMYQQGAMTGAGMGQNAAANSYGAGSTLQQGGLNMLPYGDQIMQNAFDPQKELYARNLHNVTEQTRAGQSARGIAMTPYGAGVENEALSDFNIDWANTQLGRQATGANAAGGLLNNAGRGITAGGAMMNQAGQDYNAAWQMPWTAFNNINQAGTGALSGYLGAAGQGQALDLGQINAYLDYLRTGNQAAGVANQTAGLGLQQSDQAFKQNQTMGGQFGQGLSGLFSPNNWGWAKDLYSPGGSSSGFSFGGGLA